MHRSGFSVIAVACVVACGRTTIQDAHEANGQVFYTERTLPGVGESFVHGVAFDCAGGVRDDDRALQLVPTPQGCTRDALTISYVPDGVHRVEGCGEVWRVVCLKQSTASGPSGPLQCDVACRVDDHFVETK